MANGKAWLGRTFGRYLFEHVTIARVESIGPRFRRIELEGPTIGDQRWSAGDKIQVFLGDAGMRTYTPFDWVPNEKRVSLLVHAHGASPGASFGSRARVGDTCSFFGPRRSLGLEAVEGPIVTFGDETSLALARTLRGSRAADDLVHVFEASSRAETSEVADALALAGTTVVERASSEAHLDPIASRLGDALRARPGATMVWSGRARSIQRLRRMLAAAGVEPRRHLAKAYWADGRVGLD